MNDFLLLTLLFAVPGVVVYVARPDLRPMIHKSALGSLPFAASERFFAGTYWSPPSLFNLIDRIGFGIEDVLFVVALATYMSTGYAFFFRRRFATEAHTGGGDRTSGVLRAVLLVGGTLGLALALVALKVHILYGSFIAMGCIALIILWSRRDLLAPAFFGGAIAVGTYAIVCLVYARLRPGVFERVWHTERFIHRFALGIPVEELVYGFLAGVVASVFYPYVTGLRYEAKR